MSVQAYILFKVNSGTEREVCEKIVEFDEVLTADIIYGEYDVITKVFVPNLAALETFTTDKIRKIPSILLTSTMIIARKYKGKNVLSKKL